MQICTLTQTHNHASIPPLSFLQAGCPSCLPTNSIKTLTALPGTVSSNYCIIESMGSLCRLQQASLAPHTPTHTHTHPLNNLFFRTTWVSQQQKGKPFWILIRRDDGWQWHQLNHMQIICTSLQTDNHASTSSLIFLQAGCTP